MPLAGVNGIEIFYDTFGRKTDPAIILIRGLGSQMISWRQPFCEALARRKFFVIRFDNRDVGLSTKLTPEDFPKLDPSRPYTLDDMAADTVGLLDHLGIDEAHVVGMSMGGMIAQLVAINHPERVLSLTSIMSTIGGDDVVPPEPDAAVIFTGPAPTTRDEAIAKSLSERRIIGSPAFFDEEEALELATRSFDRCYHPAGRARQMLAIQAAAPRRGELADLSIPTVVIHGVQDPLVPVENGRRTADAIPGAELVEIDGMGHDIPPGVWEPVINAIVSVASRATTSA
jgi:pimeloyl-ACP methyl ester carboxylesterase